MQQQRFNPNGNNPTQVLNTSPAIYQPNQPDALIGWETLPPSARVRLPVVCALLAVSPATVWRLVAAKKLRTYKLTPRTTTFNVGEIRALIASSTVGLPAGVDHA